MSRSRKRTPIAGITTAPSDKPFKQAEHRRERAAVRGALAGDMELPSPREFGSSSKSLKDGKFYLPGEPKLIRK